MATKTISATEGLAAEAIRLLERLGTLQRTNAASGPVLFPNGIESIQLKLHLNNVGSVELDISGVRKALAAPLDSISFIPPSAAAEGPPCTPANAVSARIATKCADLWDANKGDCNVFVKAVSTPFFGDLFGTSNADGIINFLRDSTNKWTESTEISEAIANAAAGQFVIAGMTSGELGQAHGHLAVVIGCPGQLSGNVIVPLGYAGSLDNPSARIAGARLSGTFPAQKVRDEEVSYFSKAPTI